MARVYSIEKVKNLFTKVSLTDQYKLEIPVDDNIKNFISGNDDIFNRDDSASFGGLNEKVSIMCRSTELPGQSLETVPLYGARQGLFEMFPTSRRFLPLNCTFYVDKDHDVLRFFNRWVNYINPTIVNGADILEEGLRVNSSPQGIGVNNRANFYKMRYKEDYATEIVLTKFEKDSVDPGDRYRPRTSQPFQQVEGLSYKFYRAYPREITATPVSYDTPDALQVTVVFEYEKFQCF